MGMKETFKELPLSICFQLQNPQKGKMKKPFVFVPAAIICGVHYATQNGQRIGCTLIGHWLFDCAKKHPTFVDKTFLKVLL